MKNQVKGLIPLIVLVVVFVVLMTALNSLPNYLAVTWFIVTILLFICLLVRIFVIQPKVREQLQLDVGLSDAEIKTNKTFKKEVKRLAGQSFIGDLAGYFWLFAILFLLRAFVYEPFKIPSGSMQPTLEIGDYIAVNKASVRIMNPITQGTWFRTGTINNGDVLVFKSPAAPNEDWIKRTMGVPGDVVYYDEVNQRWTVLKDCTDKQAAANNLPKNANAIYAGQLDANLFAGCKLVDMQYGEFQQTTDYYYHDQYQLQRTETMNLPNGDKVEHQTLQNPQAIAFSQIDGLPHQEGIPVNTWVVPEDQYLMIGDNRDNSNDSRFIGFVPFDNIVGKTKFVWMSLKYNADGTQMEGVNFKRFFHAVK